MADVCVFGELIHLNDILMLTIKQGSLVYKVRAKVKNKVLAEGDGLLDYICVVRTLQVPNEWNTMRINLRNNKSIDIKELPNLFGRNITAD